MIDLAVEAEASGRIGVVIVGAGSGTRLGGVDKAFMQLDGRALIGHAVDAFEGVDEVDEIVLVVGPHRIAEARKLSSESRWRKVFSVVAGGDTRQQSVVAGITALGECTLIAIHDAARPLVTAEIIRSGFASARSHGAAVAAIPVRDTLKRSVGQPLLVESTVDRAGLWAAQTPQVFRSSVLSKSYQLIGDRASEYTDDAGIVEAAGFPVAIFPGSVGNLKVTLRDDLPVATALLRARDSGRESRAREREVSQLRIGTGYDIHRLDTGRTFVLGGVVIPHTTGFVGHSDGDVLAHAVIDALLGAAGLGDIGSHFPPHDEAFRDADSMELLRRAVQLAAASNLHPLQVDATVICERPRLAAHLPEMCQRLASALGVGVETVNIKAKTNEGLDAVGEGRAVAVHALVTLH